MDEDKSNMTVIDDYISQFPSEIQIKLQLIRETIKKAAPDAQEKISWRMPTFTLNGNLVHFAAHKKHIGFYPGPEAIEAFQEELSKYKNSKGAVQFPYHEEMPIDLITRIVKYRVNEKSR